MKRSLKANEVASILGVNLITAYKMGKDGLIGTFRVGKRGVRFPEAEVERYLAEHKIERRVAV